MQVLLLFLLVNLYDLSTLFHTKQEPNKNRFEVRRVEVFDDFYNIDKDKFFGVKAIVKVTPNNSITFSIPINL